MSDNDILTRKSFSQLVLNTMEKYKLGAIDTVIDICEKRDIDPADARKLIDPTVKGMIEREAVDLNMIKGSKSRLDEFLSE